MDKLFELKEWVTLDEAKKHLNGILKQKIKKTDLYRLALDGHIILSVNFINGADAKLGKIINFSDLTEVHFYESPVIEVLVKDGKLPTDTPNKTPKGKVLDDSRQQQFIPDNWDDEHRERTDDKDVHRDKLSTVWGVWDIVPVWNGKLEIEHKYYLSIEGVSSTAINLEGILLKQDDAACELYTRHKTITRDDVDDFNKQISQCGVSPLGKIDDTGLSKLNENLRNSFYPSNALPDDAIWCIRTCELNDFIKAHINATPETQEPKQQLEPTGAHLAIIGAMLQLLTTGKDNGSANIFKANNNQDTIANAIETFSRDYVARTGLSATTASAIFSEANKYLKSKKN